MKHDTHNTQISQVPGGIRTHNLSRRVAEDLRLRPRGHWDRLYNLHCAKLFCILLSDCIYSIFLYTHDEIKVPFSGVLSDFLLEDSQASSVCLGDSDG